MDDPARAGLDWKRDRPVGPPLGLDELHAAIGLLRSNARRNRARAVLDFSSDLSESAGEPISRANMHILGFPPPGLQHAFSLSSGKRARTDFYNRIRSHGVRMIRWEWGDAVDLSRLGPILAEAGLRPSIPAAGSVLQLPVQA